MKIPTPQSWQEKLMDKFCVMFERAQDDFMVEKLESFISAEIKKAKIETAENIKKLKTDVGELDTYYAVPVDDIDDYIKKLG